MNKYERLNEQHNDRDKKRKVAAYCRVSTEHEDQANSFASQCLYFTQYIKHHPDWEFYGIFADEGISGTNTKKRKEFNRMIDCAKNGDFDLILTKEISRFARNTLDSIYYTRDLKKHGVGVIFMNDNINTLDADAELRLAIMSSIAQEESRKTSERVKWGQKRRMEQGVVFGRSLLGYDVKDGKMYLNEKGAETVRRIFHKFVNENKGTHVIARELREEGILPMNKKEWQNTTILRILRNEKYCGDLVQKKTYTPDFLSHEKKYNRGQEEFVILKNHHEPIVSRELFEKANRILDARSFTQKGKSKYSSRYSFSGKIECGCCHSACVARYKTRKDGSRYQAWRCQSAVKYGKPHPDHNGRQIGCFGTAVRNEELIHIMRLVTHTLFFDRNELTNHLTGIIKSVISRSKQPELLTEITAAIRNFTNRTLKSADTDCEIADACGRFAAPTEYEGEFYRQLLDKIVIHDRNNIDIYLYFLPVKLSYQAADLLSEKSNEQTADLLFEKSNEQAADLLSASDTE